MDAEGTAVFGNKNETVKNVVSKSGDAGSAEGRKCVV